MCITRRRALLVAAGLGAGLGVSTRGCAGVKSMQAVDFERARISWTTKGGGINGSWRVISTACRKDSADCIYLAPAVMAGNIFGTGRLAIDPRFSYKLV